MKANYGRGRHAPPIEERFWYYVEKSDGCWLWRGSLSSGYGYLGINYKKIGAHVFSWEMVNGKVPEGMFVCHHCDVRNCVRPDHLFAGTQKDNMNDCVIKNRARGGSMPGERHPEAKLTWDAVQEIRRRYNDQLIRPRQIDLAKIFGVSRTAIARVVQGKGWICPSL